MVLAVVSPPPSRPMASRSVRRVAALQLRGRVGAVRVRVYWPASAAGLPAGVLVLAPTTATAASAPSACPGGSAGSAAVDRFSRGLCASAGVVVLAIQPRVPVPATPPVPERVDGDAAELDATSTVTHWAADHARELGAASRLVVMGAGRAADLALAVAGRARDQGWPPIHRVVLICPEPPGATTPGAAGSAGAAGAPAPAASLVGLAPAIVVSGDCGGPDAGSRCVGTLRGAGVDVALIRPLGSTAGEPAPDPSAPSCRPERVADVLAKALRRSWAEAATPERDEGPQR